jgi:hypothetical protein
LSRRQNVNSGDTEAPKVVRAVGGLSVHPLTRFQPPREGSDL